MPDISPFEERGSHAESGYQRIMTRLVDVLSRSGEGFKGISDCSLYKDLADVQKRYENPVLIAQGGMKRIYRVLDKMTDREVALAVIHSISGEQLVEQFILEARITARLEHPNIMPIYDIGLDESGEPFFTMKLVRGKSLGTILHSLNEGDKEFQRQYHLDILLDIFIKVCDAVAYAHNSGLLHLDIKPDNIQIDSFGQVLVCDWGLSRYRSPLASEDKHIEIAYGKKNITLSDNISGTPGYMSPEQVLKPLTELNEASDIYSLGCILYEILTYKMPIEKDALKTMLERTVSGDIIPPRNRVKDANIPSSIESVCIKAISFDPDSRYATAGELSREILSFRGGYATEAENAGFIKQFTLLITRHKTVCGIILSALFAITATATWSFMAVNNKRQEAERLVKELREVRQKDVAPARKNSAINSYNAFNYDDANKFLKEALEITPNDLSLHEIQGFINLGSGKFREAARIFKRINSPFLQKYIQFCDKIATTENNLPKERMHELLTLLSKDGNEAALNQFLINESAHFTSLDEKIQFAYDVLGTLNPLSPKIGMSCTIGGNSLKISLAGNKQLLNIEALAILPISSLDLSDTKVSNISALRKLPLEELKLNGSLVNSLEPLSGSGIRTLDISYTKIITLNSLNFPKLEKLTMFDVELNDLTAPKSFPCLNEVNLSKSLFNENALKQADLPGRITVNRL